MCCSHAELVCEQVKAHVDALYSGQLTVDWVGTGPHGRSDNENRAIIRKFCPEKVDGIRRPEDIKLDILVHVGMAGEGLDTFFVSDVVHLNSATLNNSNRQENGRAARYLENVLGVIHVDASSDFHEYVGPNIELSFDYNGLEDAANCDEDIDKSRPNNEIPKLPKDPLIRIYDMELIRIVTNEQATNMAKALIQAGPAITGQPWSEDLINNDSFMEFAKNAYKKMKNEELEKFNDKATVKQWKEKVDSALGLVTSRALKAIYGEKGRLPASMAGEIKRKINTRKKRELGAVDQDVTLLKEHYQWIRSLETILIEGDVPKWLL
jgi:hypothetical protein